MRNSTIVDGNISITRPSYNDGREVIEIVIGDNDASTQVARVMLSFSDFAKVLTGQGYIPCDIDVDFDHLSHVGMVKERITVTAEMDDTDWGDRNTVAGDAINDELKDINKGVKIPWVSTNSFNSQDSFTYNHDQSKHICKTQAVRWVPKEESE